MHNNVIATQHLLEAVKERDDVRFVYASSSSIYGDAELRPTPEERAPQPLSPYGQTKLAAEHLCSLYRANYGVDAVSLRYFTVFGPRQRPDMAFHIFCRAALEERPITVFGDGRQTPRLHATSATSSPPPSPPATRRSTTTASSTSAAARRPRSARCWS